MATSQKVRGNLSVAAKRKAARALTKLCPEFKVSFEHDSCYDSEEWEQAESKGHLYSAQIDCEARHGFEHLMASIVLDDRESSDLAHLLARKLKRISHEFYAMAKRIEGAKGGAA